MNLHDVLISEGRTKWLDIGNGGRFDDGFEYVDILPPSKKRLKYHKINVIEASDKELASLGKFDLIRMQHFLEHLEFEDGLKLLKRLPLMMAKDSYLLITVPDLRIHIKSYLKGSYNKWGGFGWWAHKRIPLNSPSSFYFSIIAHSMPWESHKWCYDYEGLEFLVRKASKYKNIRNLKVNDKLSNVPFTHNRPEEDVCIIAQKK